MRITLKQAKDGTVKVRFRATGAQDGVALKNAVVGTGLTLATASDLTRIIENLQAQGYVGTLKRDDATVKEWQLSIPKGGAQ